MSAPLRAVWVALFALLLGEALLLSPPQRPDQTAWILRLLTGDWAGEEPLVVALFQLMGVWPLALAALLAPWLRREPVPLWPFALGSMALGAFSLLPGLALGGTPVPPARWQQRLGSRVVAGGIAVPALVLFGWGVVAGSPSAFAAIWRTEQFVHVMALDFLTLWAVSIGVARHQGGPWALTFVPVLGALAYRAARPLDA
ncbi:MAG: hypothetical protein R3F61_09785 [Myxococcota bacterium]